MADRWTKGLSKMWKVRKGSGKQRGGAIVVRPRGRPAAPEHSHDALAQALSGLVKA